MSCSCSPHDACIILKHVLAQPHRARPIPSRCTTSMSMGSIYMRSHDSIWHHMHDMTGECKTPRHMMWHARRQNHITSKDLTWHDTTSHHMTWRVPNLTTLSFLRSPVTYRFNRITSFHPATDLMTSKRITSQHMTSAPRNGWRLSITWHDVSQL